MRGIATLLAMTALLLPASSSGQANGVSNPNDYTQTYRNPTPGRLPVTMWYMYNKDVDSPELYRTMAECGANLVMYILPADSATINQSLRWSRETGLKFFLMNSYMLKPDPASRFVDLYRNNPQIVGFSIKDEPTASEFPELRKIRDAIYSQDTTKLLYTNLSPNIEAKQLHANNYATYVNEFVEQVNPPFISYDHYPIRQYKGEIYVEKNYYSNLEEIMKASKRYNRPFWGFAMIREEKYFPKPKISYLRYQLMSNLAYGAQGVQYYSYYATPKADGLPSAAYLSDGTTSPTWDMIKQVNQELEALTHVFLGAKVVDVRHTGMEIPQGTKALVTPPAPFTRIHSGSAGILISHIRNSGKNYVVMVNHDVFNKQRVRLGYKGKVFLIGSDGQGRLYRKSSITLDPGGYAIFSY